MHIDEIEPIDVPASDHWNITLNKLRRLSPEDADCVTGLADGVTIWDVYFVQDLFQAVNSQESQLIDVGWYPDGAPDGRFRLAVIGKSTSDGEFDWSKPLVLCETRSVNHMLDELREVLSMPG